MDKIQKQILDKFFDPVINVDNLEKLRTWLRQQLSEEIELFLHFFDFQFHADREMVLVQELERRRQRKEKRSKWLDRAYGFLAGVLITALGAFLAVALG